MNATVLIVDDEANLRRMLAAVLEAEGYGVAEADGGDAAIRVCERTNPDVVLLDLIMEPGPDGIAVLEQLRARFADLVVVMMSGQATLADAVRATKLGAFQFLEKPLSPENVLATVAAAVELSRTRVENLALRAGLPPDDEIIGSSAPMQVVRDLIDRVGATPSRVLITGESGTGKELVARAIHRAGDRAAKPMVAVNCAAVPSGLLESEMFGHERGAFTGAVATRKGKFELANESTLFLDEIGDMHLDLQAKLLRILETGLVERVGAERERVWRALTDPAEVVGWDEARTALVDRERRYPEVGESVRWRSKLGKVALVLNETPNEIEPPERLALACNAGTLRFEALYLLVDEPADRAQAERTRVSLKLSSRNTLQLIGADIDRFAIRKLLIGRIDCTLRALQKWCEN